MRDPQGVSNGFLCNGGNKVSVRNISGFAIRAPYEGPIMGF